VPDRKGKTASIHHLSKAKEVIDDGGILPDLIRILVRAGYAGYDHLPTVRRVRSAPAPRRAVGL